MAALAAHDCNNFKIIWVTNFWDKPLAGLCRVNGELRRFSAEYDEQGYTTYPLTNFEKVKWIIRKWIFEICVGTHFSYDYKSSGFFHWRRPKWLHKFLFNCYYNDVYKRWYKR